MNPNKYIFENLSLIGKRAQWQMLLSEYVTQKVFKGSALVRYLTHQPIEDYQPMQPNFPIEDILALSNVIANYFYENKWKLFFYGAFNALGSETNAMITFSENQYVKMTTRLCFNCTNNFVEYEAYIIGIWATIESKAKVLDVYGDSASVIHQSRGKCETRD